MTNQQETNRPDHTPSTRRSFGLTLPVAFPASLDSVRFAHSGASSPVVPSRALPASRPFSRKAPAFRRLVITI